MLRKTQLLNWFGRPNNPRRRRDNRRSLPPAAESLETRQLLTEFVVATTGDDWNAGTLDSPYLTLRRALDAAQAGDTISLRNGVYEGGVNIDVDNLTIRSLPGEWAVLESPLTQFTDGHANSVLRYNFDVQGGRLENLEISGGYWYGVMLWDWWDSNWDAGSTHVGASGITIDGCKIHDTGVDAVKITPGADDISILNTEIYGTGRRTTSSADGIDNNNGDRMIARGNYIHDVAGIGILTSGGTVESLIEQNLIVNPAGAGIVVGFYSEAEWMEPGSNPDWFTSIDTVARNNIIVDAGQAGIGIYAAKNPLVANNTIVNAAADAQAPIQFGGVDIWLSDSDPYHHVASSNATVVNNIVTTAPNNDTRMVDIREASLSGPLTLDHNLYQGTSVRGTLFIDRNITGDGTPEQTLSQWQANYGHDLHSFIAEPNLGADWHLLANSPAIGAAIGLAGVTNDFDGNARADGAPDLGADEFNAGPVRPTPPAAFGAPSLEIDARGYHDAEGNVIHVRVVRQGSTADTVTVQYATLEGSAKDGQDFVAAAGTLTLAPGETEKLVAVTLLSDSAAEGDEHFLFTLSQPTTDGSYPVRLGHQSAASMTIDDAQTPITLHYATKWVSNDGSDVTGDGSAANPWKSLQHAADNVIAGDYVIVKPGQYWGFQVTTDGKADARITFHAMDGVEIDAPNPENNLDGINLEGADYVTIEGFTVRGMPRAGLRSVLNTGAIFRDNVSDDNGYWGLLTGWSYDLLVENNEVSRSHVEHGIYISNSSDDAVVRNNVVWGNNDSGIQFNADGSLEGDGVHSRNVIEGNVVYGNGVGGGAAINLDGFQDGVVQNNLLYDNHATGIVLYVGYAADSSTNNLVRNNTVVMAEDARWALLMTDGSSGNTVINNILLNRNPNRGSMTVENNSLPARSDHNIVQDLFQTDGANVNFAAWQAFSGGQDAHSLVVSQGSVTASLANLFIDPSTGDFHLKSGSGAIDAGDGSEAPAVDIFQHARPTGAGVDIGAFEAGEFVPSVQFEWNDVIGYEFIGISEIAVTRTGDTEGGLAVQISITDGTAVAGSDYSATGGLLVFKAGETRKTFRVFVNDDSAIEDRETVRLGLKVVGDPTGLIPTDQVGDPTGLFPTDQVGDPTGLELDDTATLHIISDDAWRPGRIEFDAKTVTVNEADGTAVVTVRRVDGANGTVAINFAVDAFVPPRQATWVKKHTDLLYPTDRDTAATAGSDHSITQGTLTFAEGETEKTITVPILDDLWHEGGEAFVVKLSQPTGGATLGQSQVKVHIDSDDVKQPGAFTFSSTAYTVTEGQASVAVTVNRVGGSNVEASVRLYHTGAGNDSKTGSAWWPSDYGSLPEVLTFAPGETSKTIAIPIIDDASTEMDEVFSIQLYSPSNDAAVENVPKTFVTILDNESTFYFRAADPNAWSYEAGEAAGSLPVTVYRQGALTTPASVKVSTSDWGSAIAGADYTPISVTLNFAVGEASRTVYVPILNDTLMETKESFAVNMSNVVGASQGSWTWSAYIVDDDGVSSPGKLEFSAANYSISEDGGSVNITVNRVGGSQGTVTVQYRTLDGASGVSSSQTAWAGADYSSRSGTITFAPGETSKVTSVPITNDGSVETDEFFSIELRTPGGGATIGSVSKAVIRIVEDDSAIEFGTSNYVVNESDGYITITVIRKGNTAGTARVDLNISSGTATAGSDFVKPDSPTVIFEAGESVKTIKIKLIDDVFKETDEMFYLSLSNVSGAKLGSSLWGNVKILASD